MTWANITNLSKTPLLQMFLAVTLMIEGIVPNNCEEILAECKITKALHDTSVMKSKGKNNTITTLTSNQCKK